jgi:hypothetical protein
MESERKRPGNPLYPSEARQIFEVHKTTNCWITEDGDGRRVIRLKYWPLMAVRPLEDEDFFLSFARLGARGDPSDYQIKKWMAKYSLPMAGDMNSGHIEGQPGGSKQEWWHASMTVAEFNQQVRHARELLILYTDISRREVNRLKIRAARPKSALDQGIKRAFRHLDYYQLKQLVKKGVAKEGKAEISVSFPVLMNNVSVHMSQVRVKPVVFLDSMSQSYECPNVLSALYFQFDLFIRNEMPMRFCDHPTCRTPFPVSRSDRYHCNKTCRSGVRHHR